jgi:hypothetical protein
MACSIIRNKETNELEQVLAPNGKDSLLFSGILDIQDDPEESLRMWAQVYTDAFKNEKGDWETNKQESAVNLDENGEPLIQYITGLNEVAPTDTEDFNKAPTVESQKKTIGNNVAAEFAFKISNNLNIPYSQITANEARELTDKAKNPWNGEGAFFFGGKVFFVEDGFTSESVLHEFSHPLVAAVFAQNKELFNKLYSDILMTEEGKSILEQVKALYPELTEDDAHFQQEILTRGLAKEAENETNQVKNSKSFTDFINKMIFAFKQALRKIFGKTVKIEKLSTKTSLSELADMLRSDQFNIDTEIFTEKDMVDYLRDISNFTKELMSVEQTEMAIASKRFYSVVSSQIRRIKENGNYSEARKFLVDEATKRGDLQELKDTLSNADIDKLLDDMYEDVQAREKAVQSFVHAMLHLNKITDKIYNHLQELATKGDSQDIIKDVFYYDLLMRNWSTFIDETINGLSDAGLSPNTDFSRLASGVKHTIDQSARSISKIYANALDDVMLEHLKPLAEEIDRYYSDIIEQLTSKNQKQSEIDRVQKKWDSQRLTKERVNDLLTGNAVDTNIFSSFLESFTNSPDPIVGGFANFLKSAYNDVEAQSLRLSNEMSRELDPLLKAAGYSNTNFAKLMKELVYEESKPYIDPKDGLMKTRKVLAFKSMFKEHLVELASLRHDYNLAVASGDETTADQKLKEIREHKKDYFHQEYVAEYYNREQIYNSEVGKEAYRKKHELLNEIKNLTDQEYDPNHIDEILSQKKILWRRYSQLASLTDENGNPKVGNDLEIAQIERQYRKDSRKFFEWLPTNKFESTLRRIEQNMVDDGISPDSPEFKIARDKWIKENTVIAYTPQFYEERNQIISDLKDFMAKLPKSTQDLVDSSGEMENMLSLSTGFRDQDGQIIGGDFSQTSKDKIKEYQKSIQDKRKSLYNGLTDDEQSELDSLFTKKDFSFGKRLSPEDDARLSELIDKGISLRINILQKAELASLYQRLSEIQSKEATDYYTDIVNNYLDKMGEKPFDENNENTVDSILDPSSYVRLFSKSPEFEKWFKDNHITKEVYDRESGEIITKYERLFVWNRNRPNNEEHYEKITLSDGEQIQGKPSLSYFFRSVKKEYRTKKVVGETIDNRGNFLPKTVEQGAKDDRYYNHDYAKLERENPNAFALMEKLKEIHLKNQALFPRESRLYLEIPRYGKENLEYLQDTSVGKESNKFIEWAKGLKESVLGAADDAESAGFNFDASKLMYTDVFGEDIQRIPITGMYALDVDQVSLNIIDGMRNYMRSGLKQKKLIELNPFAQALQNVTANRIAKNNKGLAKAAAALGKYFNVNQKTNRGRTISNIIQREFSGIHTNSWLGGDNKGILGGVANTIAPTIQKITNKAGSIASFGLFASNVLPSAVKNRMGALVQNLIESSGGRFISLQSYHLGKVKAVKMLMAHTMSLYETGTKSLDAQMMLLFDPGQMVFEKFMKHQFGRSLAGDAAGLSFFTSPRQFLDLEVQTELLSGMLHHQRVMQTIDGVTTELRYVDAWEIRNGQIELKEGIDKEWAQGGNKFNQFKNRSHELNNRLVGTYAKMDQPEVMRYALGRIAFFLKRYFISMFMNRFAKTRTSNALGTVSTGYYTSTLLAAAKLVRTRSMGSITSEEKINAKKFAADAALQMFMAMMLVYVFSWFGAEDPDKYDKMKERSGALNEDDFNLPGWLFNHTLVATLATLNETETFGILNPVEYNASKGEWNLSLGRRSLKQAGSTVKSMGDPTSLWNTTGQKMADAYSNFALYLEEKDNAYWKKDTGPYWFQKSGEPKFWKDIFSIFGFTGTQVSPVEAAEKEMYKQRR